MYYYVAIVAPLIFFIIFGNIMFIRTRARRLLAELNRKGLLIYCYPVILVEQGRSSEFVSPTTGLPPPPGYSATPPQHPYGGTQQQNPSYNIDVPPPSYMSAFKTPPTVPNVQSLSRSTSN